MHILYVIIKRGEELQAYREAVKVTNVFLCVFYTLLNADFMKKKHDILFEFGAVNSEWCPKCK